VHFEGAGGGVIPGARTPIQRAALAI